MKEVGKSGVGFLCFFTSRTVRAVKPLPAEDQERVVLGSSGERMRRRRC
jgi:hypothetical protein